MSSPLVVDADSHLTEPHDLGTSRAPARLRGRVPRFAEVDGRPAWIADGDALDTEIVNALMGENAARLYRIS